MERRDFLRRLTNMSLVGVALSNVSVRILEKAIRSTPRGGMLVPFMYGDGKEPIGYMVFNGKGEVVDMVEAPSMRRGGGGRYHE